VSRRMKIGLSLEDRSSRVSHAVSKPQAMPLTAVAYLRKVVAFVELCLLKTQLPG
jgi:hypothetical protein